jgi:hypothetical protein
MAKYVGPVSAETVQAAYMSVSEYVDESGFNPDDMRHPRWLHPIAAEDPDAETELEQALALRGIPFERFGGIDGIRASFDVTLLQARGMYITRWPAKDGKYGMGYAPQYAIRNDGWRGSLAELLAIQNLQADAPRPAGYQLDNWSSKS